MSEFLLELARLMDKHKITLGESNFFDGENDYSSWAFVGKEIKIEMHQAEKFVTNIHFKKV